jgi:protein-disulfide isomerase
MIKKIFIAILFFLITSCDQGSQGQSNSSNLSIIKVFSSLTCPHCADFHEKIFDNLDREYIAVGKIKFRHIAFPLDLAALNAEKILRCKSEQDIDYQLLSEIYKKQNKWAVGSDIKLINISIKEIGKKFNLKEDEMNSCLEDKNLEDKILNERIEAQKNYKISSTPTIYINDKKYEGKRDYKSLKKEIDKVL